jgi:glutamate racemase
MAFSNTTKDSQIAVIDSGVGGITVLKSLVELLPNENYLYIGDTLNNPYGDKTNDEIRELTMKIIDYLHKTDVKALVIACNTINSFMYSEILRHFKKIVIGVIFPTVDYVNSLGVNKVGVIATKATINNGAYQKMLEKDVYPLSTPSFVKLVESKDYLKENAISHIESTLKPLFDSNIEALVLGCTHYPFLKPQIESMFDGVVIESGFVTALQLKERLEHFELTNDTGGRIRLNVTKDVLNFNSIIREYVSFSYTLEKIKI